jgi:hypothetical protein
MIATSAFTTDNITDAEVDFGAYLARETHTVPTGPDTERNLIIGEGEIVQTGDKTNDFLKNTHFSSGVEFTPAGARVTWIKGFQARKGANRLHVYIANYGTFRLVYSY